MSDKDHSGIVPLSGVDCGVKNCKYHSIGNKCTADCINVKNESAMKKAETFCGTFAPKTDNIPSDIGRNYPF